ncbi:MAG: type II toxin-antitoxin system PemK/MazF family toxin [Armatimonadetes bacterium]|nr:type II toxin-antitoxin system PemK/MazF family toxin [Armatimonadota bacterium]
MAEGDVVLVSLDQADGKRKNRPAIALREMPPYGDLLVCGLSTQFHRYTAGLDECIRPADEDSDDSGVRSESVIRLAFPAVVPRNQIVGSIGSISAQRHRRLLESLSAHLLGATPGDP